MKAININTQAWGKLGILAINQIATINPLVRRAKQTIGLVESLGFTPTANQKENIRISDPVIAQPDKDTLIDHPTESLTVAYERVAFGIEALEQDHGKVREQALKLASATAELASFFLQLFKVFCSALHPKKNLNAGLSLVYKSKTSIL